MMFSLVSNNANASQHVPAAALFLSVLHERADRAALVGMGICDFTPASPDPAPGTDQARTDKEIRLNGHPVEAAHVPFGVNPTQV